jgi:hypothetical protein
MVNQLSGIRDPPISRARSKNPTAREFSSAVRHVLPKGLVEGGCFGTLRNIRNSGMRASQEMPSRCRHLETYARGIFTVNVLPRPG